MTSRSRESKIKQRALDVSGTELTKSAKTELSALMVSNGQSEKSMDWIRNG